jgi:hypothetical protein
MAHAADVLLWEPHGSFRSRFMGQAIADATGGPFCHASLTIRANGFLLDGGYHYAINGYMRHLSSEVRENSGSISVFRPVPELDAITEHEVANNVMGSLTGRYAIGNIGLITLALTCGWAKHLPFADDWFRAAIRRASHRRTGAICSQDVHRGYRMKGKTVLVDGKDEALISPNDLARSPRLKYVGTLTWPTHWMR